MRRLIATAVLMAAVTARGDEPPNCDAERQAVNRNTAERGTRPDFVQVEEFDGRWFSATRNALARIYAALAPPPPAAAVAAPVTAAPTPQGVVPPAGPEVVPEVIQPTFDAPAPHPRPHGVPGPRPRSDDEQPPRRRD